MSDWIKFNRSLLANPKVDAMLAILSQRRNVTLRVTSRDTVIVTLLSLFFVINDHADGELVRNADEDWVDRHSTEGFASALQKVGWLEVTEEGLRFPKFLNHNSPARSRKPAKSNAERQAEYRARKKGVTSPPAESPASDVTSNDDVMLRCNVTVTERREEKRRDINKESNHAGVREAGKPDPETELVEKIVTAYTKRKDAPMECRQAVLAALRGGEDGVTILSAVQRYVTEIEASPHGWDNAYIPNAKAFFTGAQWGSIGGLIARLKTNGEKVIRHQQEQKRLPVTTGLTLDWNNS